MRLSLLLPAWKHMQGSAVLARWTARADRIAGSAPGRNTALRECFTVEEDALPIAALTRSVDADDAAGELWLRADPAFVMADAVTLRLLACGNLALSADEVTAFVHALAPTFEECGLTLDAPHPQRWYLRGLDGAKLPTFSPPDDALGDDLGRHMPEGDDARRWRGLLNEVQIVLTQHPANTQRTRRGLPPVNSLWFWGGGMLPQSVRSEFAKVYSSDEVVVALAKRAKAEWSAEPGDARERSLDRKSTRLNSSHITPSRMPSSA